MNLSTIKIEGRRFGISDMELLASKGGVHAELAFFLQEWFSPKKTMTVQSSGSTGIPKTMEVSKERMLASAGMTCSFLGLNDRDTALLCMPLKYIGAKMVVIRSLLVGMNLICVPPSSRPLQGLAAAPDFIAMTPSQVFSSLESEEKLLRQARHIIIGGGAVSHGLREWLKDFPQYVWSTYGMTETLSHIALRRLNGPDASEWYSPFKGVSLSLTEEGALRIHAPSLAQEDIVTNDLAELRSDGSFRIKGRKDNVINSGGIKIQIEQVESALLPYLPCPFQITAAPDPKYGECVVLLAEYPTIPHADGSKERPRRISAEDITAICRAHLPAYYKPRHIFFVPALPQTGSGKPARAMARDLAQKLMKMDENTSRS